MRLRLALDVCVLFDRRSDSREEKHIPSVSAVPIKLTLRFAVDRLGNETELPKKNCKFFFKVYAIKTLI